MLPKRNRISKTDFPALIKAGKIFPSANFSLRMKFCPQNEPASHFSAVVSAKVSAKAVVRNKIKRRFYAIFAKLIPKIKNPVICAAFPKKGAEKIKFGDLYNEVSFVFMKNGLTR